MGSGSSKQNHPFVVKINPEIDKQENQGELVNKSVGFTNNKRDQLSPEKDKGQRNHKKNSENSLDFGSSENDISSKSSYLQPDARNQEQLHNNSNDSIPFEKQDGRYRFGKQHDQPKRATINDSESSFSNNNQKSDSMQSPMIKKQSYDFINITTPSQAESRLVDETVQQELNKTHKTNLTCLKAELEKSKIDQNVIQDIYILIKTYLSHLENIHAFWINIKLLNIQIVNGIQANFVIENAFGELRKIRIIQCKDLQVINYQMENHLLFQNLEHSNLVKLQDYNFRINKKQLSYYIFSDSEYYQTTLQNFAKEDIKQCKPAYNQFLKELIFSMLNLFQYFQQNQYQHGGIKPSNIYIDTTKRFNYGNNKDSLLLQSGQINQQLVSCNKQFKFKLDISSELQAYRKKFNSKERRKFESCDIYDLALTVISFLSQIQFEKLKGMLQEKKLQQIFATIMQNSFVGVSEDIKQFVQIILQENDVILENTAAEFYRIMVQYQKVSKIQILKSEIKQQFPLFCVLFYTPSLMHSYSLQTKHMQAFQLFTDFAKNKLACIVDHYVNYDTIYLLYKEQQAQEGDEKYIKCAKLNLRQKYLDEQDIFVIDCLIYGIMLGNGVVSQDQLDFKNLFTIIDKDHDGLISFEDLLYYIKSFNNISTLKLFQMRIDQVKLIFLSFDEFGSEKLNYRQFQNLINFADEEKLIQNLELQQLFELPKNYVPEAFIQSNDCLYFFGGTVDGKPTSHCYQYNLQQSATDKNSGGTLTQIGNLNQPCKNGMVFEIQNNQLLFFGIAQNKDILLAVFNMQNSNFIWLQVELTRKISQNFQKIPINNGRQAIIFNKNDIYMITYSKKTIQQDKTKIEFENPEDAELVSELLKAKQSNVVFIPNSFLFLSVDNNSRKKLDSNISFDLEQINYFEIIMNICSINENNGVLKINKFEMQSYLNSYERIKKKKTCFEIFIPLNEHEKLDNFYVDKLVQSSSDYQLFDVVRSTNQHKKYSIIQRIVNVEIESFDDGYNTVQMMMKSGQMPLMPEIHYQFITFKYDCKIRINIVVDQLLPSLWTSISPRITKPFDKEYLPLHSIYRMMKQILTVMEFLRQRGFYFKEISPMSIFQLEKRRKASYLPLFFFHENSFATYNSSKKEKIQGNTDYMEPTLLRAEQQGLNQSQIFFNVHKSNIYSLGLVLLQATALINISGLNKQVLANIQIPQIIQQQVPYPDFIKKTLLLMLAENQDERANSQTLLHHLLLARKSHEVDIFFSGLKNIMQPEVLWGYEQNKKILYIMKDNKLTKIPISLQDLVNINNKNIPRTNTIENEISQLQQQPDQNIKENNLLKIQEIKQDNFIQSTSNKDIDQSIQQQTSNQELSEKANSDRQIKIKEENLIDKKFNIIDFFFSLEKGGIYILINIKKLQQWKILMWGQGKWWYINNVDKMAQLQFQSSNIYVENDKIYFIGGFRYTSLGLQKSQQTYILDMNTGKLDFLQKLQFEMGRGKTFKSEQGFICIEQEFIQLGQKYIINIVEFISSQKIFKCYCIYFEDCLENFVIHPINTSSFLIIDSKDLYQAYAISLESRKSVKLIIKNKKNILFTSSPAVGKLSSLNNFSDAANMNLQCNSPLSLHDVTSLKRNFTREKEINVIVYDIQEENLILKNFSLNLENHVLQIESDQILH